MNFVQPIRDMSLVKQIANNLEERSERDFIMFMLGINLGFRISDILALRVRDVIGRTYLTIHQKKTGETLQLPINKSLRRALDRYCDDKDPKQHLIYSPTKKNEALSRVRCYQILRSAAEEVGLECIGCHTMRKTFGYHLYKKTKDIELVRRALGQTSVASTRRYIGIDSEEVDKAVMSLNFMR